MMFQLFSALKSITMKLVPFFFLFLVMQGCSSDHDNYYTKTDFATVEKVDVHAHIQSDRDAFAEQAAKDNIKLITIALDADNRLESVKRLYHFSKQARDRHPKNDNIFYRFFNGRMG